MRCATTVHVAAFVAGRHIELDLAISRRSTRRPRWSPGPLASPAARATMASLQICGAWAWSSSRCSSDGSRSRRRHLSLALALALALNLAQILALPVTLTSHVASGDHRRPDIGCHTCMPRTLSCRSRSRDRICAQEMASPNHRPRETTPCLLSCARRSCAVPRPRARSAPRARCRASYLPRPSPCSTRCSASTRAAGPPSSRCVATLGSPSRDRRR